MCWLVPKGQVGVKQFPWEEEITYGNPSTLWLWVGKQVCQLNELPNLPRETEVRKSTRDVIDGDDDVSNHELNSHRTG